MDVLTVDIENSSKEEQLYALMIENAAMAAKIKSLLTEGVKIEAQEGGE